MLTIPKLQAFALEVRKAFPESGAIVAGGAVRDLLHDRPVKDIDVFLRLDIGTFSPGLARFERAGWPAAAAGWPAYPDSIFTVDIPAGVHMTPAQLVFVPVDPEWFVENVFDFGLSQAWVTPGRLRMTSAYWADHFSRSITYLRSRGDDIPAPELRASSARRAERLREKYAGWRFRNCGGLES